MKIQRANRLKKQKGVALIVALLALVLLAAIGVGLMFMADTENSINNNYRDAQKAYFAARAGAENVRLLLAPGKPLNAPALALTMPAKLVSSSVIYVPNPNPALGETTIDPTSGAYLDDELCQEQFVSLGIQITLGPCAGTNHVPPLTSFSTPATLTPAVTLSTADIPGLNGANALAFKWVRITNKQNFMGLQNQQVSSAALAGQQICWNGTQEVPLPAGTASCGLMTPTANPVWLLTSLAVTPKLGQNPGSRRMVQMEVALNPPLIAPAPISTQAPVNLQGKFVLNAYDNCTCTSATTGKGANAVTTYGIPRTPGGTCRDQAHAVYTGGTVKLTGGSGTTATVYGSDPTQGASVQGVNPWPYNIDDLINQYKAGASNPGYSCSGTANFFATPPSYLSCGTQSKQTFGTYPSGLPDTEPDPNTLNAVTEYIPGSVHLTAGASGAGILIIDGDLDINGGLSWYGLILVRGQVSFTGGGADSVNLYGSILAGKDVNATDQQQGATDTFGGSISFNYDICAMQNLNASRPPRMLASHELSF